MTSKPTVHNFFATSEDLAKILREIEAEFDLDYVKCGLFDSVEGARNSLSLWDDLSVAHFGDSNLEPVFLLKLRGKAVKVREVPQKKGGTKYAVDQLMNPGTVVIRPGGVYGDSALIAGMVGTVHHDGEATMIMAAFSAAIRKAFMKVKSFLVGPEATTLLDRGFRLTNSVKAPSAFDLTR